MPPKALPMVATGRPSAQAATEASATTISMRGQCGRSRRSATSVATDARESASVAALTVGSAAQIAGSFSSSGPGSGPARVRPRSGTSWLAKMIAAMPAVKPTVTG